MHFEAQAVVDPDPFFCLLLLDVLTGNAEHFFGVVPLSADSRFEAGLLALSGLEAAEIAVKGRRERSKNQAARQSLPRE
jgi:hypothetical protein